MQSSESSICVNVISHFTNVICLCAAAWVLNTHHHATGCAWARTLNRKKRSDVQTIPCQMGQCLHEEIEEISTLLAGSTRVSRRVTRQGGLTWLDYYFHANAYKHLTAKGLPAAVIQPGIKSNPGSCKEALRGFEKAEKVKVLFALTNTADMT